MTPELLLQTRVNINLTFRFLPLRLSNRAFPPLAPFVFLLDATRIFPDLPRITEKQSRNAEQREVKIESIVL